MATARISRTGAALCAACFLRASPLFCAEDRAVGPLSSLTDFALVDTSGNSKTRTVRVAERLGARLSQIYAASVGGSGYWSRFNRTTTAEWYQADARLDRRLNARLYAYGMGGWERNVFAGIVRRTHGGAGLGLLAYTSELQQLNLEAGGSLTEERRTDRTRFDSGQARAGLAYRLRLSGTATLEESFNVFHTFADSRDRRCRSDTALQVGISRWLGVRLSYVYMYRGRPVPLFGKVDRIFSSGLTVTF